MTAVFEQAYVKKLNGPNVKKGTSKMDLAEQLMEDIKTLQGDERLRPRWSPSGAARPRSIASRPTSTRRSTTFEAGLEASDDDIAPSQIYAYACLKMGVPYANGAPNLSRRHARAARARAQAGPADHRQGLQDRPDADEDDPRARLQGAHARPRRAGTRRTSSATATARCSTIPSRSRARKSPSSA